jgi:lactoylglutathione lyase
LRNKKFPGIDLKCALWNKLETEDTQFEKQSKKREVRRMKFQGYHHIGLIVRDADKSLAFYKKLGGEEVFNFPMGDSGKTIYLVDLGGHAVVEIVPRGEGGEEANARWAHIALETGDARAAYDHALKIGAQTKSEPHDGQLGTMSVCNAFVLGQDGESIEFFQVKK